jgi:hypothetical protein
MSQPEREVGRHRRLADAALARSDRDDVADSLDRSQLAGRGVGRYLPFDVDDDAALARKRPPAVLAQILRP